MQMLCEVPEGSDGLNGISNHKHLIFLGQKHLNAVYDAPIYL